MTANRFPDRRKAAALIGAAALLFAGGASKFAGAAWAQPRYRDGEFTGQPFDTPWGAVQVRAVIRGGALVDVQYLQFPDHRMRSVQISNEALPLLRAEAIKVQSAPVSIISGATATSECFRDSMASALALAWKGGGA
jgi:uncharacterized protein with FMN-binding domain